MAKRKATVRASRSKAPKKPAKKKAAAPKRPRKPSPRQERLLDDMPKDRALDNICRTIREAMEQVNEGNGIIKGEKAKALARMQASSTFVYRAHGLELIRVPGDEKIRAKQTDSDEGGEDPGDPVPGTDAGAGDVLDEEGADL